MTEKLYIYQGRGLNPYQNLAIEKLLLEKAGLGECILYLWQNQNTVVIGHNQNAWAECRTTLLEEEGGHLARRLSGGGAVFHDVGNLNFTFLISSDDYDVDKQLQVIIRACALCGIKAEKSGRNDLLTDGHKFSGNAFYHHAGHSYHHGTLLIDVDMQKLQRYLSPPKAKLQAKGVASVRSRVVNLKELSPALTCDSMREFMHRAFEDVYGLTAEAITLTAEEMAAAEALAREYSSWEYLYGSKLQFSFCCEDRFPWGHITVQLDAAQGKVNQAKVYSDAMDWDLAPKLEEALMGCTFRVADLCQAVLDAISGEAAEDICRMLRAQQI